MRWYQRGYERSGLFGKMNSIRARRRKINPANRVYLDGGR